MHFHIHPIDVLPEVNMPSGKSELPRKPDLAFDVDAFLSGDYCLEDVSHSIFNNAVSSVLLNYKFITN